MTHELSNGGSWKVRSYIHTEGDLFDCVRKQCDLSDDERKRQYDQICSEILAVAVHRR